MLRALLQRARLRANVRHPPGRVRISQVLRGGVQEQPQVRDHRTTPEPSGRFRTSRQGSLLPQETHSDQGSIERKLLI